MPVACTLHSLNTELDSDELHEKVDDLEVSVDDDNANSLIDSGIVEDVDPSNFDLKMSTRRVAKEGNRVRFEVEYDRLKPRGHRAGEDPWYREVERFSTHFSENLFGNGGFLIFGGKSQRSSAELHLQDLLGLGPSDYERRNLTTDVIESILSQDAKRSMTRAAEDIDEYTPAAAAHGKLDESGSHGEELKLDGDITYEMYESLSYDGTVGIARETVTFYGNIWDEQTRMNYLERVIAPEIVQNGT